MSDKTQEHDETSHALKNPTQVFWAGLAGLLVPVIVIIGLVTFFSAGRDKAPGASHSPEKVAQRIEKVGKVQIGAPEDDGQVPASEAEQASADDNQPAGKKLYDSTCFACHANGTAGAPKFGDKDEWAPIIASGLPAMMEIAINGKGAMPPRGGSQATDEELHDAVVYMADASGGNFGSDAAPAKTSDSEAAKTDDKASDDAKADDVKADDAKADDKASDDAKADDKKSDEQADGAAAATTAVAAPGQKEAPEGASKDDADKDDADKDDAKTESKSADVDVAAGKKLYEATCQVCHAAGVAGAPKFGDKDEWAPIIATGMDAMMDIAIHGKGAMPPRGSSQASDEELRDAVEYMVQAAQ